MIDVKEILSDAEERMEMAAMFLDEALAKVRAGRANIAIVSGTAAPISSDICLLLPISSLFLSFQNVP